MTSLFDRIGGRPALTAVVEDFYDRLATDPRVLHHFPDEVMVRLRAAQVTWLTGALGGAPGRPLADLAEAHKDVEITDEQVGVVVAHLDAAIARAGVDPELRRQVMSVIARLWYARIF